jgi:DNA-binding transcriptional ArsR family regulator
MESEDRHPVGDLQSVLTAITDPVRLQMLRRLHRDGGPVPCSQLYEGISKSTASHHFKVLREAGVTERCTVGGQAHQRLRLDEVEQAYPGVLSSILAAQPTAAP